MRWVQRRDSDFRYNGLDSLVGSRIVLSRGYFYGSSLQTDTRLIRGYATDFVQAARMLLAGRADLTLEDERTALFHFSRELEGVSDALSFLPGEFNLLDLSLVVRNDHPQQAAIIEAFNREIAAMLEDGSYAAIFHRHGLPAPLALP
ncbi:substrate-binding periplasmic protein [Pseudomonas sp. NPDC077382]